MKFFFCSLFICFLNVLCAQQRYKADSLLQVLEHTSGKDRVETLRHLSRAYIGADKEKSIYYAKESYKEAELLNDETLMVRSLNNLVVALQNTGEYRQSITYLEKGIIITRKNGNKDQLLDCLSNMATAYAGLRKTDKALPYAQESITLAEELKDSVFIINGLEIIAAAYKDLHKYDEAIRIYQREIDLLNYLPSRLFENGRVNVNLGEVYSSMKKEKEAIALFLKGKKYFSQFGYPSGIQYANAALADAYMKNNQLVEAQKIYNEILEINKSIQDPELSSVSFNGLGIIKMQQNQYQEAFNHLKQAENIAKLASLHIVLKDVYSNLNDLSCLQGDYEKAKTFKELSKIYADSILNANVLDRISEYQVQYETAQKEKEIAEKKLQITSQQSEIFRKNTLNFSLLASLIAFIVLAWLFYNRFRLRKKAELDAAIIQEQRQGLNAVIEAQENERKRIAKDLHDSIAQELVALKLGFNKLRNKIEAHVPAEAALMLDLENQLNDSCTEVRNISHIMMPPALEHAGLTSALETLLHNVMQHANIKIQFECGELTSGVDKKIELGLYRIVQELLNNVIKHAHANNVLLQFYQANQNLIMRLEDDGIGFDYHHEKNKGSMGLLNILSRVITLGGTFNTEPAEPHGTISTIRIPL